MAEAAIIVALLVGLAIGWGNAPLLDKAHGVERDKVVTVEKVVEKPCPAKEPWYKLWR